MKPLPITAALAIGVLLIACRPRYELAGTRLLAPHPAPDIALESVDGPTSLHDFKGQYTFVFFGYTHCPDVCPTTLAVLREVKQGLGKDGDQMQFVMITVDPERDTPEQLAQFLGFFDSSFVGLSGDPEDIERIGEPFGLYYHLHEESEAGAYLVDHTARLFLLDRDSNAILTYAHETAPDVILQDLQHLIEDS